ncbi:DUF6600 domain-containing protein [Bacteroidota bacterium]
MKKVILFSLIIIAISFNESDARKLRYSSNDGVTFEFFFGVLQPHGEWVEIDYDIYAWRPTFVDYSWRPYSHGRWVWSSYGWYWDSYEPFGWATYHYGRWYYDNYYGWLWIPDYEWGPAWVEWRYNDHYIGWAPLSPYAHFSIDFGIRFSINWHSNHHYWSFVSYPHFCHTEVNYYIVDNRKVYNFFDNTKYRTNYYHNNGRIVHGGIDRKYVERKSGYRVAEREIGTTSNFNDYTRTRHKDVKKLTAYKPSENQVRQYRSVDKSKVVKSGRSTSLKTDKIISRSQNDKNRDVQKNKSISNTERQSINKSVKKRNTDIKSSERKKVASNDIYKKTSRKKDKEMKKYSVSNKKMKSGNETIRKPQINQEKRNKSSVESKKAGTNYKKSNNSDHRKSKSVKAKDSRKASVRKSKNESSYKKKSTSKTNKRSSSVNKKRDVRSSKYKPEKKKNTNKKISSR